jgi:hypothetical protein
MGFLLQWGTAVSAGALSTVAVACGSADGAAATPGPDAGAGPDGAAGLEGGSDAPAEAATGSDAADAASRAPTPSGCIDTVASGHHVFTCDGLKYDVQLPSACSGGGCGAVLDVHGATMNAQAEDNNSNMRAIGEREGYVVIQPNASGSPPTAVWNPGVDYDKVWAFFELALNAFAIDPKRVHMMGFSQGGRMTFTFACAHADRLASAAPAAETGCTQTELQAMKRELPILYMHGRNDALVNFNTAAIPQRDAIIAGWGLGAPSVVGTDANYLWSRYTNPAGAIFEFIEHGYESPQALIKGHCYPGSTDPSSVPGQLFSFACTGPNAFVWGEEAMKFFKAHPMP